MVDNIQTHMNDIRHLTRKTHFDSERMAGTVPVWESGPGGKTTEAKATSNGLVLASRDIGAEVAAGKAPSLSFGELLDVINPLHHIPVVGDLYRKFTGDEISSVARIMGGGIYGGPAGFAASIANAAVEEHSGKTVMDNIISNALNDGADAPESNIKLTQEKMPPPSQRWHFNS